MVGWPQRDGDRGCERDKTKANFTVMLPSAYCVGP
jgi:hypothetical protein